MQTGGGGDRGDTKMSVMYERVALIGLGLIASSMAHAMRRRGLAGEIVGTARTPETRETAQRLGFCDRIVDTPAKAVAATRLRITARPMAIARTARSAKRTVAPLAKRMRNADRVNAAKVVAWRRMPVTATKIVR